MSERGKKLPSLPLHAVGKVEVKSTVFEGLRIHIRGGTSLCSTTDMQKLVLSNGGELVLNLTKETARKADLVLVGDETVQVQNVIRMVTQDPEFDIDIVRFAWAHDSIARSELCRFFPWYWVHLSQQTRERMNSVMDVDTGIVWGERPDLETCKQIYRCFKSKSRENGKPTSESSARGLKRFRDQLDPAVYDILWTSSTFLRDVVAYCIPECLHAASHGIPCGSAKMLGNCIKIYSGKTVNDYSADITHIVTCDAPNFHWRESADASLRERFKSVRIVGKQWLDYCLQNQHDRTALAQSDALHGRAVQFI